MSKKSIVQREKRREVLVEKYRNLRSSLKLRIGMEESLEKKLDLYCKIQKLPRDSSLSRLVGYKLNFFIFKYFMDITKNY